MPEEPTVVEQAEAQKFLAEAAKFQADARLADLHIESQKRYLEQQRRDIDFNRAADIEHQIYHFRGVVEEGSVSSCIAYMTRWSRLKPGCEMTIVINSPGGYVTDGMELFDTILELRRAGHKITGVGRGYVASMGSILLQAVDHRVMGPDCSMLIHEPSGVALGSLGEIADTKEWLDMLAARVLDVYAERCASSGAERPYTRTQLKNGWNRKNWWLNSDDCLKGGLIDEIR